MIPKDGNGSAYAVLGGGCFWCLEALYVTVPGVKSVTSGYAGGTVPDPSYEQVCTGRTNHAEVVMIEYDPAKLRYSDILAGFWKAHDPTTPDRQGADVGTQYRSIILYTTEEQKAAAERSIQEASGRFRRPIVTQVVPLEAFYRAEDYHQRYFEKNPGAGYCRAVIAPKLQKFSFEAPHLA